MLDKLESNEAKLFYLVYNLHIKKKISDLQRGYLKGKIMCNIADLIIKVDPTLYGQFTNFN
jgi:hypothetical protein